MHNHLVPPVFQSLLTPLVGDITNYPLRNRQNYTLPHNRLSLSENSFLPSTIKLWNSLDDEIKNKHTVSSFKSSIQQPKSANHSLNYNFQGYRKLAILFCRLRHNCSILNYDLYRCNLINDPSCSCGNPCENTFHYLFECPLYIQCRDTMVFELQNFDITLNLLLFGSENVSPDDNAAIFRVVQRYIRDTERF